MKVLVFGSREWVQEGVILRILSKLPKDTILIHGNARGADKAADRVGRSLGFEIRTYPVTPEEWDEFGKAAGHMRNAKMLASEHPDSSGVKLDKAYGFSTGPVTKTQNRGTHDMMEKLWAASVRFEILFPV
jgi:hypothetical protein